MLCLLRYPQNGKVVKGSCYMGQAGQGLEDLGAEVGFGKKRGQRENNQPENGEGGGQRGST